MERGGGGDGYILIILKMFMQRECSSSTTFRAKLFNRFCGWNVNYLINCAKSCYENFDNDDKMGDFLTSQWVGGGGGELKHSLT